MPRKSSRAIVPIKFAIPILIGVILLLGLTVSVILGSTSQENRSQAAIAVPTPAQKTCHKYANGKCTTFYVSATTCGADNTGPCPTVAITCDGWSECTNGGKNCSTPGGAQGLQTQKCSDGSIRQQYCSLKACGTTTAPSPTPYATVCNNSLTSIQNDCRYKPNGDPCVKGGYKGVCRRNSAADCTCETQTVKASLCSVGGSDTCSNGSSYVSNGCFTADGRNGKCVNTSGKSTQCTCSPYDLKPAEQKCSTIGSSTNCLGQIAGSTCTFNWVDTAHCYPTGATDSTGPICTCSLVKPITPLPSPLPSPTPIIVTSRCISNGSACSLKNQGDDCRVTLFGEAGTCISSGTEPGSIPPQQRCLCIANSIPQSRRCNQGGSPQCMGLPSDGTGSCVYTNPHTGQTGIGWCRGYELGNGSTNGNPCTCNP